MKEWCLVKMGFLVKELVIFLSVSRELYSSEKNRVLFLRKRLRELFGVL